MGAVTASLTLAIASAATAPGAPLHYSFEVARANGAIYNPWTLSDDKVELRSFIGSGEKAGDFVAPTIRVAPGQRLEIDIANRLEPCTDKQRSERSCFNDTNLHTHGMWISPSGASDNVLISIAPGEDHHYVFDVPKDHPAGTFWYHPHQHGTGLVRRPPHHHRAHTAKVGPVSGSSGPAVRAAAATAPRGRHGSGA